ncbi:unnamed protein product [Owenia fusiformis]|uniref:Uncharacterized protein n=1 Tax=Owenia fusiformis TaxID=6347 RepID=A0A8S4PLT9_OWEFU|nr:unnamed protein product [Owenia fusiformis]
MNNSFPTLSTSSKFAQRVHFCASKSLVRSERVSIMMRTDIRVPTKQWLGRDEDFLDYLVNNDNDAEKAEPVLNCYGRGKKLPSLSSLKFPEKLLQLMSEAARSSSSLGRGKGRAKILQQVPSEDAYPGSHPGSHRGSHPGSHPGSVHSGGKLSYSSNERLSKGDIGPDDFESVDTDSTHDSLKRYKYRPAYQSGQKIALDNNETAYMKPTSILNPSRPFKGFTTMAFHRTPDVKCTEEFPTLSGAVGKTKQTVDKKQWTKQLKAVKPNEPIFNHSNELNNLTTLRKTETHNSQNKKKYLNDEAKKPKLTLANAFAMHLPTCRSQATPQQALNISPDVVVEELFFESEGCTDESNIKVMNAKYSQNLVNTCTNKQSQGNSVSSDIEHGKSSVPYSDQFQDAVVENNQVNQKIDNQNDLGTKTHDEGDPIHTCSALIQFGPLKKVTGPNVLTMENLPLSLEPINLEDTLLMYGAVEHIQLCQLDNSITAQVTMGDADHVIWIKDGLDGDDVIFGQTIRCYSSD